MYTGMAFRRSIPLLWRDYDMPFIRRDPIAFFLAALSLVFIASPITERLGNGRLIDVILIAIMLLIGVVAVADTRTSIIIGTVLAVSSLLGKSINHFRPELMPEPVF